MGIPPKPVPPKKKDDVEEAMDHKDRKGIFWIKSKVDKEIKENVVKADDTNDEWKEEMRKHEARFKELHKDYLRRDDYVKREVETRTD